MEGKLEKLVDEYGDVEIIIQALQRLRLNQAQDDDNEIIVEVWRGDLIHEERIGLLGKDQSRPAIFYHGKPNKQRRK